MLKLTMLLWIFFELTGITKEVFAEKLEINCSRNPGKEEFRTISQESFQYF